MTAALFGAAATVMAAMFGLLGMMQTRQPSAHGADVEGLRSLVDELQEERDGWRQRALDCERLRRNGA